MPLSLDDDIQFLKHVGPARARDFGKLGIKTVRGLMFSFPRDMSDRSSIFTIADAPEDRPISLLVTPLGVEEKVVRRRGQWRGRSGSRLTITTFEMTDDSGGILEAVWFNQPWLKERLQGMRLALHGKAVRDGKRLCMEHPQYELVPGDAPLESLSFGRIVPIYPMTGSLNQAAWRRAMAFALDSRLELLEDPLPAGLVAEKRFPDLRAAVRAMHFPDDARQWHDARRRLVWEESLYLQLALLAARAHMKNDLPGRAFRLGPELDNRIRRLFPFKFTSAQDKAVREISRDMASPLPMCRLLQGDVGSGKTAVALYASLAAVTNRAQVCLMAPTGLLARQHYDTFSRYLETSPNARVRLGLLVGGMPKAERQFTLDRLKNGTIDILAATHAVISDGVEFHDLGMVVIDEQHKFGVAQRSLLVRKGVRPDLLIMTATPIPRSLALSVYGDLDLSTIDRMPPGRKPVKTLLYCGRDAGKGWSLTRDELKRGRQAFVVCPLVEENAELDLRAAGEAHRDLGAGELNGFRLGLLHGRMKRAEQQRILDEFRVGKLDAIVGTIVVEVGVDIPNCTVMAVLSAERFGLAQLHQLRGRVGRGAEQGYFLMFSDFRKGESGGRLNALLSTASGFEIAEADLRLRGPGDMVGDRQHGLPPLKLVDLVRDVELIADARESARYMLSDDPELAGREHIPVRRELVRLYGKQWDRLGMG
ncbi:MAG: ATP-dependent DNA helicase RecG [Planctomycetota bacterium]|jgi:ATP-dependent DNA helicase RecG|nr:ATP-dependent DNA helicase RecG [Planctomycetota bacterium]